MRAIFVKIHAIILLLIFKWSKKANKRMIIKLIYLFFEKFKLKKFWFKLKSVYN